MSAYNELLTGPDAACAACGALSQLVLQFKYGDTWQYRYEIGDRIRWGGNDVGEPGHAFVVVAGYPDRCAACGSGEAIYDIFIRTDVIESVKASDGAYDYVGENAGYFVLEP